MDNINPALPVPITTTSAQEVGKSNEADLRFLELLSHTFGSVSSACTEIINLEAILNLPKGTEHFVADIHGESEAFDHILRNASGNIKRKVKEIFADTLRESDIRQLCSLIYYPERKLVYLLQSEDNTEDFYRTTLHQLVKVLQSVSSKYTRSKVRKALPKEFAYIIEELLHETPSDQNKQGYYNRIIETIISTGQPNEFIIALCNVIQRLSIDVLHVLGDIYDRGPGAHLIMDTLSNYHDFDIQWGNHDALWMGAAAGNECCIVNVLRTSLKYANLITLDEGYGINLTPLATFAMETYADDECVLFYPKVPDDCDISEKRLQLMAKMHKAITVIQFKLEGNMIDRHPDWGMEDRKLLHHINFDKGEVVIGDRSYELLDKKFPTVSPENPYQLTQEEIEVVNQLKHSFIISDKLRRHVDLLFKHGSIYNISNSNLLFHASLPLEADGTPKNVRVYDGEYSGKELFTRIDMLMRAAFNRDSSKELRQYARDFYWYLWCGPDSPLFDKSKMATFERYYITDKDTHYEEKGHYYALRNNAEVCDKILDLFGVEGPHRHIINGHVPVKASRGENPIKADGRLMVIDGGFSKAYHNTTGIAGYTLVYHSRGLELVQHEPFSSTEDAIVNGTDIAGSTKIIEQDAQRILVKDTDKGRDIKAQIDELRELLYAYRHGYIKERSNTYI